MIYITGDMKKDTMLTPYVRQLNIIKNQCGIIESEKYIELVDQWLISILKAIDDYDKKTANH